MPRTRKSTPRPVSGRKASDAVDRQLARYREMRDFAVTAEPAGGHSSQGSSGALPFVIQKHAATRLHYDFRLGWNGVLKSWAVTKGPSYNPADKRLAVEVEDHPMEYGGFEGAIPKGQYGGGTVMVWDHGTWEPHGDFDAGLKSGRLKFALHGEKLKGNWTLIRMGGKAASESKPNWLLIKEHDSFERGPDAAPITEEAPDSVITGRDLDQIASAEDHVWNSNRPESSDGGKEQSASQRLRSELRAKKKAEPPALPGEAAELLRELPKEKLKDFVPPQLAVQVAAPPKGPEWFHELKLDGYRIQIHVEQAAGAGAGSSGINGRSVRLFTRSGLDWTARMPKIASEAAELPVKSALLDGEVVVLSAGGATSFADLQAAFQQGKRAPLTYFAFDLLHLDGHNLRSLPLEKRKEVLRDLLAAADTESLRYSEHLRVDGREMLRKACELGAEGLVSKLAAGQYISGRSREWLKIKCIRQQEFVIGGYTPPKTGSRGIGALLLGYYDKGKLVYAGRTGTGFPQATQKAMLPMLEKLHREKMPFAEVPRAAQKDARWVAPDLVGQVAFSTWTRDGMVRQAAFKGLREDKPAKEVRREEPADDVPETSAQKPAASPSGGKKPSDASPRSIDAHKSRDASHRSTTSHKSRAASRQLADPPPDDDPIDIGTVRLTKPEKIMDQDSGLTKRDLAAFYLGVADAMLPYVSGRPLSLLRCPDGSGKPCFFQKHIGPGLPEGVGEVEVPNPKTGDAEQYVSISGARGLAGLAQMGVLEVHPWGSRNEDLEHPDQVIFDLDPDPELAWPVLAAAAFTLRDGLKQIGLEPFVKSTGGKGLHVAAPIEPEHLWEEIKSFAQAFARLVESSDPQLYLTRMTKSARKGKIYIDYLRNQRGATAVAPYSPRARSGAPVALPLSWNELRGERPAQFRAKDFDSWKRRLQRDPWARYGASRRSLDAAVMESIIQSAKG
ncbi:MAG TPA: DNA ligase D [Acidobacteriaceae bacterium]|nr:DNA ligase D [Acidobacteriaceae bacterium]